MSTSICLPKNQIRRKPHVGAFTLIELLVVISIISLLIAILLPVLSQARESSRRVKCASNMRQVMIAFNMYINDSKGISPLAWTTPSGSPVLEYKDKWFNTMRPYLNLSDLDVKNGRTGALLCPSTPDAEGKISYSQPWGWGQLRLQVGVAKQGSLWLYGGGIPIQLITHQTQVMAFGESRARRSTPGAPVGSPHGYQDHGLFLLANSPFSTSYVAAYNPPTNDVGYDQFQPAKHNGSSNSAFVDGHVKTLEDDLLVTSWELGRNSTLFFDGDSAP